MRPQSGRIWLWTSGEGGGREGELVLDHTVRGGELRGGDRPRHDPLQRDLEAFFLSSQQRVTGFLKADAFAQHLSFLRTP